MKLLLDTHVWIWSQQNPDRLGPQSKRLLIGQQHENHVSAISTLELARLVAIGDITVSIALNDWVRQALQAIQARTVEISHDISIEAYALPGSFHKDPADRLLVATARQHELTLLTADDRILKYPGVQSRDARK